ncbi:MAG: TIM-barrel domain-containing protein [Luteolibacter sp.]
MGIFLLAHSALHAAPDPAPSTPANTDAALGDVLKIDTNGRQASIHCAQGVVRLDFWSDSIVRMQVSKDGSFSDSDDTRAFMIRPGLSFFKGVTPSFSDGKDTARLTTGKLVLEISKKPFGFRFMRPEGGAVLAEGTFQTNVRAVLKQDASGHQEHYFGLQNERDNTLDQRGRAVKVNDENGAGWSAPFVMSTAGYGLFFNNENSVNTLFTFKQPVVIENTTAKGPMDLFFIAGMDFKKILGNYADITGKPGMPPIKLLGFQYLVKGTPMDHEEAFHEWINRGYPIDSCITFTDQKVESPSEIAAVAGTAQRIHERNGFFGFYYDVHPWPGTFGISKPEPVTPPYEGWEPFKEMVKSRLLDNGADWFWTDETDVKFEPRFKHNLYTALQEVQEAHGNVRSFNCARGGYAGSQRFGYPWMGDIHYDRKMMIANLCNGLAGFPQSTHDMSGADLSGQNDTAFLNGVKCNFFNPFTQCNAWIPWQKKSHRPWEWSPEVERVFKKFSNLHYQLIPYFYTASWQAHQAGLPVWRALLLEYPKDELTYSSDQVMVGDWMMMAPLYKKPVRPVYLPEGKWYYLFDNSSSFTGPIQLSGVESPMDEYPVFIKAGAIIPMMPTMRYVGEKPLDPLTLLIYPLESGASDYEFYEDDGKTRDYLKGSYCTTRIVCEGSDKYVKILSEERKGQFKPAKRSRVLSVFQASKPAQVEYNKKPLPEFATREQMDASAEGWGYFQDDQTGVQRLFIKTSDDGQQSEVTIVRGAAPLGLAKLSPTFDNAFARRYEKIKGIASRTSFLKEDRNTAGSWRGLYGKNGYIVAGIDKNIPEQTEVDISGGMAVWTPDTRQVRALQRQSGEGRLAAAFHDTAVSIEILTEDTRPRKVTLYLLDWDGHTDPRNAQTLEDPDAKSAYERWGGNAGSGNARTTEVLATNPLTGAIYDVQKVESFHKGVYLTYEVTGSVAFNLAKIKGVNAVVSGIFFD